MSWSLQPRGYYSISAIIYDLLLFIPFLTAFFAAFIFMRTHCGIKCNKFGVISKGYQSLSKDDDDGRSFVEKLGFSGRKQTGIISWPEDKQKRRKVLIATLGYEIIDWKLKVKIGITQTRSTSLIGLPTKLDITPRPPKVKDIEYPPGEPKEPIEVIIFGESCLVEVEKHTLDNTTYVILDFPCSVLRPSPTHTPLAWTNCCLPSSTRLGTSVSLRPSSGTPISTYTTTRITMALLLPFTFQSQRRGPGFMATSYEGRDEGGVSAFNPSKENCTKYVQFGNTFRSLHKTASFISEHQNSIGVAGVSDEYGKRSWARYSALWTLEHVDSLPNRTSKIQNGLSV